MKQLKMLILALLMGTTSWANNTHAPTSAKTAKPEMATPATPDANAVTDVVIYPNPVAGKQIFLHSIEQYNLSLSDMDGNILLQKPKTNYLDISTIKGGIYLLDYKDSQGKAYQKLVTIKRK